MKRKVLKLQILALIGMASVPPAIADPMLIDGKPIGSAIKRNESTTPAAQPKETIQSTITKSSAVPATISMQRLGDLADFKQTDPRARFEGGGSYYCAPTSVSDWLMYFAHHGYPQLIKEGQDSFTQQMELIKTIASKEYMNTNPQLGTDPDPIMAGLEKFVGSRGYRLKQLKYQGWRPCRERYFAGVSVPQLDWLKGFCDDKKCALLNYGWYQYDEASNTYKRTGGHWVALVGYGKDRYGNTDPNTLIVHDPVPRFSADKVDNVYISLTKLSSGQLSGKYNGLPRYATGYYYFNSCSNGRDTKKLKECGIIDGAIVLELE